MLQKTKSGRKKQSYQSFALKLLTCLFILLTPQLSHAQSGNNVPISPGPDFDIGTLLSNYTSAGGAKLYLSQLENSLMGESHDIDTGALTFRHVDVSIPGNNSLPVTFARRADGRSHRQQNGIELGPLGYLWEVDLPYVLTRVDQGNSGNCDAVDSEGSRFSDSFVQESLDIGTKIYTPGGGERDLGSAVSNAEPGFYGSRAMGTSDLWIATCLDTANSNGVLGYEVKSPDGTIYKFDHVKSVSATFIFNRPPPKQTHFPVENVYMFPTLVTDIHGNTVTYEYNAHGVTKISSSDNRVIDINYTGSLITSVVANGRTWTYSYDSNNLSRVDLPDGETFWSFGENEVGIKNNGMLDDDCLYKRIGAAQRTITMRHPSGTVGTFVTDVIFNPVRRVPNKPYTSPVGGGMGPDTHETACSWGSLTPKLFMSRALTSKTLTLENGDTRNWTYDYHQPTGAWGQACNAYSYPSGNCVVYSKQFFTPDFDLGHAATPPTEYDIKKRTVIDPLGQKKVYHINVDWLSETLPENTGEYYKVGGMVKQELFASEISTTPIQITEFAPYNKFGRVGGYATYKSSIGNADQHFLPSIKTTYRDGDSFKEEYAYNMDPATADFAYMRPIETKLSSSVTTTPRTITTTHYNDRDNWVMLLPQTYAVNGTTIATNTYTTTKAQLETQSSYGITKATVRYNADGTIDEVEDAIGRITKLADWKRGQPETVTRGFGSADEVITTRVVDDNGWVTSETDGKNQTTAYNHDDMGRLKLIDPPSDWANTVIDYDFDSLAASVVQTIKKETTTGTVTSESVIHYDSMYQQVLQTTTEKKNNSNWSSHVNTEYDALGRVIFASNPSLDAEETDGTKTVFDALGRVKETQAIADGIVHITSTTTYGVGHKRTVMDALMQPTTYTNNGYGELVEILQPEGITTTITRNPFGNPTAIRQHGVDGDKTQELFYDAQQRLCRHHVPETDSKLYTYNDAGEISKMWSGVPLGAGGCTISTNESEATYTYTALGQVERIRYLRSPMTNHFYFKYDDNGNLEYTHRYRGQTYLQQFYDFNELNLPTTSRTQVSADADDGTPRRDFLTELTYTADGHLSKRMYPGGRWINYNSDGLGRVGQVVDEGYDPDNPTSTVLSSTPTYHPNGVASGFDFGTGAVSYSQTLDARLRPWRSHHSRAGGDVLDLTLTYNDNSRITAQVDGLNAARTRGFEYDDVGRLTDVTASDPLHGNMSYTHDVLGNLKTKSYTSGQYAGRHITLEYNARNRLAFIHDRDGEDGPYVYTGERSAGHDLRGNIAHYGPRNSGKLHMVYDATNQPIEMFGRSLGTNGSEHGPDGYEPVGIPTTKHLYDGHKRRVKTVEGAGGANPTVRYNIFDASGTLVQVYDATADARTDYVNGPAGALARIKKTAGIDATTFIHADHLGTARAGTDVNGTTLWEDWHTPFGESLIHPDATDDQGDYTGHIRDKTTGLVYMQARFYDPMIGRFLSEDPVTFLDTGSPTYFNRYSYVGNDPINMIDPYGMYACDGNSWDDGDCQKFEAGQDQALNDIGAALTGLESAKNGDEDAVAAFEDLFGVDPESSTSDRIDSVISTLTDIQSALRDKSMTAYADYTQDDPGIAPKPGTWMSFNPNLIDGSPGYTWSYVIIHESSHNMGLDHGKSPRGPGNSLVATTYRFAGRRHAEQAAFQYLKTFNPAATITNPDHIASAVYP